MVPSVSLVSRFACLWGFSGFCVRPSSSSFSGFVAVAGFRSPRQAAFFARWAAALLGRSVVVRRAGGLRWVSVPVLPASVPRFCRLGAPVSGVASPPALRWAIASGGIWAAC